MDGYSKTLTEFMDGHDKKFIIPVYQRNYDWRIEHCKKLFDDLLKVIKTNKKHFFGSIVSCVTERQSEFLIIDGQQRLTTVSLLLLAIYNLLRTNKIETKDCNLQEKILNIYLINKYQPDEKKARLKLVKNDSLAFYKLFEEDADLIENSNVTTNYKYFYNRIQKDNVSPDALYNAIQKLEIIVIGLWKEDNPQLIFESINSTGLELSEGDKIRNYILMNLSTDLQEQYYEKYWNKIEVNTGYDVSSFVRDYLTVKQSKIPNQRRVYFEFKDFKESLENQDNFDLEPLLKDLLVYSKRYEILLKGDINSRSLKACIERLNWLETTVTRPFFLEVLRLKDEGKLSIEEIEKIFSITESYLFRRTICGIKTNSLNKFFSTLHKEIVKFDNNNDEYVEKFKYVLLSKKGVNKFIPDNTFAESWTEKEVYLMNSRQRTYIFERLENAGTKEDKDIYRHFEDRDYSIEHIMPQTLNKDWRNTLGSKAIEVHEKWIDRIANLTITAYNSELGNKPYLYKKDLLKRSGIRLNNYFRDIDKWDQDEIQRRNQWLLDSALNIWPEPRTTFEPKKENKETYALDEIDFTGRNPESYTFNQETQVVKNWKDLYVEIFGYFYQKDPMLFKELIMSNQNYIGMDESKFRSPMPIDDEKRVFLEINNSTSRKIEHLLELFKLYGEDPSNLEITLQALKSNDDK